MSFWPLLLRVFLIVAFVLNGTTAAAGAATMGGTHASTSEAERISTPSASHTCHEGVEATPVVDEAPQRTGRDQQSKPPVPDCCSQSGCSCACMGAQAGAPTAHDGSITPRSGRLMPPLAKGHIEPATLHLIRPPIG
jgi:hypothetical protein